MATRATLSHRCIPPGLTRVTCIYVQPVFECLNMSRCDRAPTNDIVLRGHKLYSVNDINRTT